MDQQEEATVEATETGRREAALAEVMARIVSGDQGAVFALRDGWADELLRAVRTAARQRGAHLDAVEAGDLATDLALALADRAGAWSPEGGAPPWVWAWHQVGNVVDRHIGQWASSLDDEAGAPAEAAAAPASAGSEPEAWELLGRVASSHPHAALLVEAVEKVASPRDRRLYLEVLLQESLGDRSPAVTVGREFTMTAAAVRQQVRRVRRRLQDLVATEARFAVLADLPSVA